MSRALNSSVLEASARTTVLPAITVISTRFAVSA